MVTTRAQAEDLSELAQELQEVADGDYARSGGRRWEIHAHTGLEYDSNVALSPDGQVIPGLYAAGRTACGLPRWGEGYSSGLSLGDSTFFGRQAGRHAATRE